MRTAEKKSSPEDFYTDLAVGEILRRARLQRGLTISEAAQFLYIRQDYLEALEQSDFDALPGRVYVIGFIRTYAEFLNLDGARVVHLLKRQSQGLGTPQSLNMPMLPSDSRLPGVPVIAMTFASILLVMVIWAGYQNARIGQVDNVVDAPKPAETLATLDKISKPEPIPPVEQALPPLAETPKIETAPVHVVLLDDSWIELRSPEGRVVEARVFRKGETFDITKPVDEFGHNYALTMGNAAGVQITVQGTVLPPLGGVNKVRRNISLKPETLKSLAPSN